ncbi:MAG: SpoIID/LytB domain-containing protein [FCB group bacterium]|nr:SpoIID/LytB domain-containing protein [FCB group bacterium]
MTERGQIPEVEPTIRVGIILPEDRQTNVQLDLSNLPDFQIIPGKLPVESPRYNIEVEQDFLLVNGSRLDKLHIRRPDTGIDLEKTIAVHPVVAGRGFHWEKKIRVNLLGDLELTVHGGSLLVINTLPLEQYLMCVATSEMNAACPSALIQSQTIAARSWMLANVEQKHRDLGFDVCNDDCCQRYQGTNELTRQALDGALATRGQVLLYENAICDTRYSKSCGGMTESFETIWGGDAIPYLPVHRDSENNGWKDLSLSTETNAARWIQSAPPAFCGPATVPEDSLIRYLGSVDKSGKYYRWKVKYTQSEITELFNLKLNLQAANVIKIIPVSRGGSGRLNRIRIQYTDGNHEIKSREITSEYEIRRILHPRFLYSSAFIIDHQALDNDIPGKFTLWGAGWGHGVGLCQIGALGMALKGYTAPAILAHYYPGSELTKIYS